MFHSSNSFSHKLIVVNTERAIRENRSFSFFFGFFRV